MSRFRFPLSRYVAIIFLALALPTTMTHAQSTLVYVGSYTGPKSKGIYVMRLDPESGALSAPEVAAELPSPSFLTIHPSQKLLYAVSEVNGKGGGVVSAYSIATNTGKLNLLNQQPSGGAAACFIGLDPAGKTALVANYGGGSVESLPIGDDGKLGPPGTFIQHVGKSIDPGRQQGPHGHSINSDPAGHFAFAADLGLDQILSYKLDAAKGTLTPNDPPFTSIKPGSGPRHLVFHPSGKFVYVISEMACTITAFNYDADKGTLAEMQVVSTLPVGFKGSANCAEVQVHPSGKFLYGSNRAADTLAIFTIDEKTGMLTPAGHQSTGGKTPRNFRIDPSGKWLLAANQDSDSIVEFRIDRNFGTLIPTGVSVSVGSPVCIKFVEVK